MSTTMTEPRARDREAGRGGSDRRGRRLRRWAILLSPLLALAVAFAVFIHNPVAGGLADATVLIDPGADWVLDVPDFPGFVGALRTQGFYRDLDRHPGFQAFLGSPIVRDTAILPSLSRALTELESGVGALPLGLDSLERLAGRRVLVAGYAPEGPGRDWRFVLVARPGSWKALAAVNVLSNSLLSGLLVAPRLPRGVTVAHDLAQLDGGVRLSVEGRGGTRILYVARVRDHVLLGTEERVMAAMRKRVEVDEALPPDSRYVRAFPLDAASASELRVLARPGFLDGTLGLVELLRKNWGPEIFGLVTRMLPALADDDVWLRVGLEETLDLAGSLPTAAGGSSLIEHFRRCDAAEIGPRLTTVLENIPEGLFAAAAAVVPLADVLDFLLRSREIVSESEYRELNEGLKPVAKLGSVRGLVEAARAIFDDRVAVVFFPEERDGPVLRDTPGFALIAGLRDRSRLVELLRDIAGGIDAGTVRGLTGVESSESGGLLRYRLGLAQGVVDDPEYTKPGIALVEDICILTNWSPLFDAMEEVRAGRRPSAAERPDLAGALLGSVGDRLVTGAVDVPAMYRYFDQVMEVWVVKRTTMKQIDYVTKRREFSAKYGPEEGERWLERYERELGTVERTRLRAEMKRYLDHFRGLFRTLALKVDLPDQRTDFRVRLATHR